MISTLLTQSSAGDGFRWTGLLIVLVVFAVVYPLQARLRKTLSERRRSQWAEREGRQHPPTGPDDQS